MNKIFNKLYWGVFLFICAVLVFKNYISKSDLYLRYKYGLGYNQERLEKGILLLPDNFELYDGQHDKENIVWINPKPEYSDSSYVHLNKTLIIRNSKLFIEKDVLKLKFSNSKEYKQLTSKYYYNASGENDKLLYITHHYVNDSIKEIDTVSVLDNIRSINRINTIFDKHLK